MPHARPAVGVRHVRYPEYLRIYRPSPPFLENSHALSGLERRLYATRFTLRNAYRLRVDEKCGFGTRHRVENRCRGAQEK
jgi:hypothetical protein